ncbi:MAG: heparan-alpha-glucosaminide N-acetyltransferase domain-containing protein [Planctomycetota bacterium]
MTEPATEPQKPAKRLLSLDVFRGFDIALMILVNMTWDRERLPDQMFHVGWNGGEQGATITDLVFPWFLFIVGVAMPFSMTYGRGARLTRTQRLLGAFRRGLTIYTLGLILDAASSGSFVFLKWNILQLIGAAYLLGVIVLMLPRWAQITFVAAVLLAKWYVLSIMPHPEHGESVWYFAKDGVPVENRYERGAVPVNGEQVLKSAMLGWREWLPGGSFWSPLLNWLTNIFNLLPATAVVVMGSWVGRVLIRDEDRRPQTAYQLMGLGAGLWLVSWIWTAGFWAWHHPWSKDFFTASYAALSVGTGTLTLGLFYLLIDAERSWRTPELLERLGGGAAYFFRVLGVNAIALYFGNEFVFKAIGTKWKLAALSTEQPMINAYYGLIREWLGLTAGGWAFAFTWLAIWWAFCWWLYRNRWFIKV